MSDNGRLELSLGDATQNNNTEDLETNSNVVALVPVETTIEEDKLANTLNDVAGQLSVNSRRIYRQDTAHFAAWLNDQHLSLPTLTRSDMIRYRAHLQESYAKNTAARMLTVARRLLKEAVKQEILPTNPADDLRGFRTGDNETTHVALSHREAKELLASIDTSNAKGKRDYALIMLLLRTGIRRSECAALTLQDLKQEQGHNVALIRHGKGDKRRKAKIPVDVMRTIQAYLEASGRAILQGSDAPLFVQFKKGDRPTEQGLGDKSIENIVKHYAAALGIEGLTPHGLRASFVTLALEGGASLHQVQYAAGHADPRTTERYQKRKLNLDDNATDYLRLT